MLVYSGDSKRLRLWPLPCERPPLCWPIGTTHCSYHTAPLLTPENPGAPTHQKMNDGRLQSGFPSNLPFDHLATVTFKILALSFPP